MDVEYQRVLKNTKIKGLWVKIIQAKTEEKMPGISTI